MGDVDLSISCLERGGNSDSEVLVRRQVGLVVHRVKLSVVNHCAHDLVSGIAASTATRGESNRDGHFLGIGQRILDTSLERQF